MGGRLSLHLLLGCVFFSGLEIPPTPVIVDQYYNTSTREGDDGEIDAMGPWNTDIEVIDSSALTGFQVLKATSKAGKTTQDWAKQDSAKRARAKSND